MMTITEVLGDNGSKVALLSMAAGVTLVVADDDISFVLPLSREETNQLRSAVGNQSVSEVNLTGHDDHPVFIVVHPFEDGRLVFLVRDDDSDAVIVPMSVEDSATFRKALA